MRRHIAFISAPTVGEIIPTLAIVDELVRRGHRITYATVPDRRALVESVGAQAVCYDSTIPGDTDRDLAKPDRLAYIPVVRENFLAEAEATLSRLGGYFADDVPDMIVYGAQSLAGRIIAANLGIPAVACWTYLSANDHWSIGRHLGIVDPHDTSQADFKARLEAFTATRLTGDRQRFDTGLPDRHLMLYPRSFQYASETFGERYAFIGPCLGRRPWQEDWTPPDPERPVLLISLGTVYNRDPAFYRLALAAFAGTPWQVLLAAGHRTDPAELGPIPANAQVGATLPQLGILRHAAAFVTHAGMGGIMEALSYAVPMVTVPQTPEQEVNAERVTSLGLGVRLDADGLTGAGLRTAVDRLVGDPVTAARLAAARDEIGAGGGAARGADVIEAVAARTPETSL